MGQRHQLFVIARINGRYRQLCIANHNWLYGHTAIKRCHQIITIFQDPGNRLALEQELLVAKEKAQLIWPATSIEGDPEHDMDVHIRFPFIATCLTLGASFGVDEGYHHGVSIVPLHLHYIERGHSDDGKYGVQEMAPLSGQTYLKAYYDLDDPEHGPRMQPSLDRLNKHPLIPTSTLGDLWPDADWEEPETDAALLEPSDTRDDHASLTAKLGTLSLRQSSTDQILQSLDSPSDENLDLLAQLDQLPGVLSNKLKQRLYEQAKTLEASPYVVAVLKKALEKDVDVDLSPFRTLSAHNLSTIVAHLREHGAMVGLILSDRPDLTEVDLDLILGPVQPCKRLYLLENPQISTQYLTARLGNYELFHSDLFRRALVEDDDNRYKDCPDRQQFDFSATNDLAQVIWVGIPEKMIIKADHIDMSQVEEVESQHGYESGYVRGFKFRRYLTNDIPISAGKAVKGLLRLLQWIVSHEFSLGIASDFGSGVGCAFATTASTMDADNVGALSTSLYAYPRRNDYSRRLQPVATGPPALKTGQWALIVVHEAYDTTPKRMRDKQVEAAAAKGHEKPKYASETVRYALVTPIATPPPAGKRFKIVDVPTYAKEVLGNDEKNVKELEQLMEFWKIQFALIDSDIYEKDDIHDLLENVFSQNDGLTEGNQPALDGEERSE
ncbi:MAG: hypothetical protein L6R40_008694 [Gallowayella cf. fulva]|nr:MAG: hypothetical protein L6R40_008694 [Xanthomendoza cf. fulva]